MPNETGILSVLEAGLRKDDWGQDGLLHASTDLVGPLRHTMLRMAGAPIREHTFAELMTFAVGKDMHDRFQTSLSDAHLPVMKEVAITDGLPGGWSGTIDTLLWDVERRAFILYDYKTQKGEAMQYIMRDGAKKEHMWQTSAYWHALVALGFPMVNRIGVVYVPKNEDRKADEPVYPVIEEVKPLDKNVLWAEMDMRRKQVDEYLSSLPGTEQHHIVGLSEKAYYVTPALAGRMPREQKLVKKLDKWEILLMPHWSEQFCRYDDELCPCGTGQSTEKIGHFEKHGNGSGWIYQPRQGYELTEPEVAPVGVKL